MSDNKDDRQPSMTRNVFEYAQWIWDNEIALESSGVIDYHIETLRKLNERDDKING